MIKELSNRLSEINVVLLGKQQLENRILENQKDIHKNSYNIRLFSTKLEKEKKDVTQLKKLSLYSIYATVMGGKLERLNREENEYLNAKTEYDNLITEKDELYDYSEKCNNDLKEIKELEIEFDTLIEQKKILMLDISEELNKKLTEKTSKVDYLKFDLKRTKLGISEGYKLYLIIDELLKTLESASFYGGLDVMMRDSRGLSKKKFKFIDRSNRLITKLEVRYLNYKKDMFLINFNLGKVDLKFDSKTRRKDIYRDSRFTDKAVQEKIKSVQAQVKKVYNEVRLSLKELDSRLIQVEKELFIEEENLDKIVLEF